MELNRIGQISITAHDIDRATALYRDVLKLQHLFSFPRLAFFDCDGIRLMLALPETAALDHPSSIIYFKVVDIQGGYNDLVSRGDFERSPSLVAQMETHDLWLAQFRDSEANIMCLMSEVPKA